MAQPGESLGGTGVGVGEGVGNGVGVSTGVAVAMETALREPESSGAQAVTSKSNVPARAIASGAGRIDMSMERRCGTGISQA